MGFIVGQFGSILAVRVLSGSLLIERTKSAPSIDSVDIFEYICKFYDLNTTDKLFAYSNMYLSLKIAINLN